MKTDLKKEDFIRVLEQYNQTYNIQKSEYEQLDLKTKDYYIQTILFKKSFGMYSEEETHKIYEDFVKEFNQSMHEKNSLKYELTNIVQMYNQLLLIINERYGSVDGYEKLKLDI